MSVAFDFFHATRLPFKHQNDDKLYFLAVQFGARHGAALEAREKRGKAFRCNNPSLLRAWTPLHMPYIQCLEKRD